MKLPAVADNPFMTSSNEAVFVVSIFVYFLTCECAGTKICLDSPESGLGVRDVPNFKFLVGSCRVPRLL